MFTAIEKKEKELKDEKKVEKIKEGMYYSFKVDHNIQNAKMKAGTISTIGT